MLLFWLTTTLDTPVWVWRTSANFYHCQSIIYLTIYGSTNHIQLWKQRVPTGFGNCSTLHHGGLYTAVCHSSTELADWRHTSYHSNSLEIASLRLFHFQTPRTTGKRNNILVKAWKDHEWDARHESLVRRSNERSEDIILSGILEEHLYSISLIWWHLW